MRRFLVLSFLPLSVLVLSTCKQPLIDDPGEDPVVVDHYASDPYDEASMYVDLGESAVLSLDDGASVSVSPTTFDLGATVTIIRSPDDVALPAGYDEDTVALSSFYDVRSTQDMTGSAVLTIPYDASLIPEGTTGRLVMAVPDGDGWTYKPITTDNGETCSTQLLSATDPIVMWHFAEQPDNILNYVISNAAVESDQIDPGQDVWITGLATRQFVLPDLGQSPSATEGILGVLARANGGTEYESAVFEESVGETLGAFNLFLETGTDIPIRYGLNHVDLVVKSEYTPTDMNEAFSRPNARVEFYVTSPVEMPFNFTVAMHTLNKLRLEWEYNDPAGKLTQIFRRVLPDGEWVDRGLTDQASYYDSTVDTDLDYQYAIRAVNSADVASDWVLSGDVFYPLAGEVSNFEVIPADGAALLFWTDPVGDEFFTGVRVVYGSGEPDIDFTGWENSRGTTIDGLQNGTEYTFRITSVNNRDVETDGVTLSATPYATSTGTVAASIGLAHADYLQSDGTLWATGNNGSGQLGDGTTSSSNVPVEVMTSVAAVSAGHSHTLILTTAGEAWATGYNGDGRLGDGTDTTCTAPVHIMDDVVQLSAGWSHSLFLTSDGSLWGAGSGDEGQLGSFVTTWTGTPVQLATGVAECSAGNNVTLFVANDGKLWAMGMNERGQLGDGTIVSRDEPVEILSNVAFARAGASHSAAVTTAGNLYVWGSNDNGQLGDGSTAERHTPSLVMNLVSGIAAGYECTMALRTDGTLWGTGMNNGRLGDGTLTTRYAFIQVRSSAVSVAGGMGSTAIITVDGTVWATGNNYYGQFGDGTNTDRQLPVPIHW